MAGEMAADKVKPPKTSAEASAPCRAPRPCAFARAVRLLFDRKLNRAQRVPFRVPKPGVPGGREGIRRTAHPS